MTRYDGRLSNPNRAAVLSGLASKKQTIATQVWLNDSVATNDTFYFCKLPKGAAVVGGRIYSGRLGSGTSAASSCMQICLGTDVILYSGSGTSYSVTSNVSAFGIWGPIDFNLVTSLTTYSNALVDSSFSAKLGGVLLTNGPLYLQADGNLFATLVNGQQLGSGFSGYLNLELDYITAVYS